MAKSAKRTENKVIKDAVLVLAVTYDAACQAAFLTHLEEQKRVVLQMAHAKRKSIVEEQGFLATIKIVDWVDVKSDYSPGLTSDGGIGCVYGLHAETVLGAIVPRTYALDVHYVIFNRKERGVAFTTVCSNTYAFQGRHAFLTCAQEGNSNRNANSNQMCDGIGQ